MIVIIGGGLSGSLLAYQLSQMNSKPDFLLIESQSNLGGEHTWSFHESDVDPDSMSWIREFVACSWNQQEVRFHEFNRVLSQRYYSVTSSKLNQIILPSIRNRLLLKEPVVKVSSNCIYLKDRKIDAQVIFDARGLSPHLLRNCGFQKFCGMDVELNQPHGLKHPIIMDSNCSQEEGYRFFYLLPWTSHSVLVEDTRYTLSPELDVETFKDEIRAYCHRSGWSIKKELRSEAGALPIPLSPFLRNSQSQDPISIGIRGGYFHWTTGYSFPYAVRISETLASVLEQNSNAQYEDFIRAIEPMQTELENQSRYFALLNRMLFLAARPSDRWKIFHRFYHFKEELICRFYRGNLTFSDRARILIGKPPVPIFRAFKSIFNSTKHSHLYGKHPSEAT